MLKVLVTGGTGMLGTAIKNILPEADYLNGRSDLDLSYPEIKDITQFLNYYDTIIHTAALTNMQVNENNPSAAYHLHSEIISHLQSKCNKLIYISAQGRNTKGVYFESKLKGEKETSKRSNDLVIRTNIVGKGGLAAWALAELKQGKSINGYTNSFFNPVHVSQLAKFITLHPTLRGTVNVCSKESMSKYTFLCNLAEAKGYNSDRIIPVELEQSQDLTVNEENNLTFNYSVPYEDVFYS